MFIFSIFSRIYNYVSPLVLEKKSSNRYFSFKKLLLFNWPFWVKRFFSTHTRIYTTSYFICQLLLGIHLKITIIVQLEFIPCYFIFKSSLSNLAVSVIEFFKTAWLTIFGPMLWICYFNFTLAVSSIYFIFSCTSPGITRMSPVNAPVWLNLTVVLPCDCTF